MRKLLGLSIASALLAGALAAGALAAGPQASASATNCALTSKQQRSLGASYVTSVRVKGVSCAKGKGVTLAFNKCRTAGGKPQGKCNRKVGKWRCAERRYDAVPGIQYSSRVTCSWGKKRVFSSYTQNT